MTIGFEQGIPVSVGGMKLPPVQLVELLNEIGARNAIGRIDLVENRFVGIKSRGCYETPGGTLIVAAHRELEALTLDRDLSHYKQHVALRYADLVYNGLWFTPLREAFDAFVQKTQENVTGTVTLSLYKGQPEHHQPRLRLVSIFDRPLVLHHGRELRSEGRQGIHPDPRAARSHSRAAAAEAERGCEVKMWSGRFREPLDARFEEWQRSFGFDWRLLPQEIAASKAHASVLAAAGILTLAESAEVRDGLDAVLKDCWDGRSARLACIRFACRGRASFCRARIDGAHWRAGSEAPHRPQPQ